MQCIYTYIRTYNDYNILSYRIGIIKLYNNQQRLCSRSVAMYRERERHCDAGWQLLTARAKVGRDS